MKESKIQWTNFTWNPAIGCDKVSPGCKYCYMMRNMGGQYKKDVIGNVTRTSDKTFYAPIKLQKQVYSGILPKGSLVFTSSLTDIFHPKIDSYRHEIWEIIKQCPDLNFQILTKRIERAKECLPVDWSSENYPNVWLGVSVENQEMTKRIWELVHIDAKVRFLSIEPLISPTVLHLNAFIKWKGWSNPDWTSKMHDFIDWVIVGGESGNKTGKWRYRPCEIKWIEMIIDECSEFNIPVFVKQLGTHLKDQLQLKDKQGGDISEWPPRLQIRQMPKQ